ncbi:hypothetical protein GCM10023158_18260 [Gluconacetobacter tumulicola]
MDEKPCPQPKRDREGQPGEWCRSARFVIGAGQTTVYEARIAEEIMPADGL